MIRWNVLIQRELIEQRSLFDLPVSHHDLQSRLVQRLNQRTSCVATEDFFNTIKGKPTSSWTGPIYGERPSGHPKAERAGLRRLGLFGPLESAGVHLPLRLHL